MARMWFNRGVKLRTYIFGTYLRIPPYVWRITGAHPIKVDR